MKEDASVRTLISAATLFLLTVPALAQTPQLDPGEKLEKLQFPAVTMQLKGWTKFGNSHVYTLPVRAGQHVKIDFATKSKFAFLAIFDLSKPDDEAFFGTDEDGMSFETTVKENTTWLMRPYYSKVSPRRGLGAPFSILIEPLAAAPKQQQPPAEPQQPSLFPKAPAKQQ
ncbi:MULTISPECIES: hypothetical protein [unclassified Rhizobium]|uniref:hypothetical protein n=1 Tax=unclassified Rhizobium TaxID=2613769 RepID=UPI0007EA4398|nr:MULTISPECIES: hypothetical protein [unclassified Rhizobium]ANM09332.1 hypothetical protein AMK05_CH00904 [Rhizobium sp. N324]ANM15803.1 hypothetical protein AMK06_CH00865 [Rhizobium sp. N541]ANM22191.1 hypothetical protein AMK07_CH00865 [Rhizobium sp. N941]OYD02900.1 hypothetical protein AMK08_CH100900 [Rhizobium sp. N4311]